MQITGHYKVQKNELIVSLCQKAMICDLQVKVKSLSLRK